MERKEVRKREKRGKNIFYKLESEDTSTNTGISQVTRHLGGEY